MANTQQLIVDKCRSHLSHLYQTAAMNCRMGCYSRAADIICEMQGALDMCEELYGRPFPGFGEAQDWIAALSDVVGDVLCSEV